MFSSVLVLDRFGNLLQLPLDYVEFRHLVRRQLLTYGRCLYPHLFCVVFLIVSNLRHEESLDCDGQLNSNEPLVKHQSDYDAENRYGRADFNHVHLPFILAPYHARCCCFRL